MIPRQTSDNPIDKISFGLMVAIGGEDASETVEVLEKQEQITRRELEQVPLRAQARGAEFMEFSATSRSDLIEILEAYLEFVVKAKNALQAYDSDETVEVYEESQEILPKLTAAMEAYSNDFARFGPYQSAPANTLARIIEGIAAGEVPETAWGEYCQYFVKGVSDQADTISQVELPGRSQMQHSCENAEKILQALAQTTPSSVQAAGTQLTQLDQCFQKFAQVEACVADSEKGPTSIPATNILLACLQAWSEEKLDKDSLSSVVEDYADLMDDYTEAFENSASKPTDSALIQEEIPRTLDAMDSHYAALEELSDGVDDLDKAKCQELVERLTSTAGQLEESREVYATAAQHQNHVVCASCGRSNPPENKNCEACGEILPRNEDGASSSTFSVLSGPTLEEHQQLEMTENVAFLFQSCDDVYDGKITGEEFLTILQGAASDLNEFIEELEGVAAMATDQSLFTEEAWEAWQATHLPYMEDVALTYQAGITETQDGLRSMHAYLEEPEQHHLVEGIRLVWQGLSTINRARLAMETHAKMVDDIISEGVDTGVITGED